MPLDSLLKNQIFFEKINLFIKISSRKKITLSEWFCGTPQIGYTIGLTPVSLEFFRKSLIYYHCNHFLFSNFERNAP